MHDCHAWLSIQDAKLVRSAEKHRISTAQKKGLFFTITLLNTKFTQLGQVRRTGTSILLQSPFWGAWLQSSTKTTELWQKREFLDVDICLQTETEDPDEFMMEWYQPRREFQRNPDLLFLFTFWGSARKPIT